MKRIFTVGLFLLAMIFITACSAPERQRVWFYSYRDIPGISEEQIQAIADIRARNHYFIYGMMQNDDAFYSVYSGEIAGFTAHMTRWLSELFDIPFIPVIFDELSDLMDGMREGSVNFTAQLPQSIALNNNFAATDPISMRSTAVVRPRRGVRPLEELMLERPLNLAFNLGAPLPNVLLNIGTLGEFNIILNNYPEEIAALLASGEADAFIGDGVISLSIDFPGFMVEPLYPFMFAYTSLAAGNEDLFPLIDVVQLALENGGMSILAQLYADGKEDAARHRLSLMLTDDECAFITDNPIIPIMVHGLSYPISFFNEHEGEFQGIAIDILRQIELISNLTFHIISNDVIGTSELNALLNNHDVYAAVGVFRAEIMDATGRILLTDGFFRDNYVMLSHANTPIIGVNEVLYKQVGILGGGSYETMLHSMFPNHVQTTRFVSHDDALDALAAGDIDLFFTSQRGLIRATHLLERTEFRANIIFAEYYYVSFAVNEQLPVLVSILDKALTIVDTATIADFWLGRTFDHTASVLRAQRPWLIGTVILLGCVLVSMIIIFLMQRSKVAAERELSQSKSRFLARMSHEIRTPISAVLGISEIQLRNFNMSPHTEEAFARIYDSSKILLSIVNDILDFSKIESGKTSLLHKAYETESLVSNVAQLHVLYAEEKDLTFTLHVDENLPSQLKGDVLRLRQIITNLLTNAFKYTEAGEVTLTLSCENTTAEQTNLVITINDTGIGMSPEQINALRGEYVRFHENEKPFVSGTGLGIPIVYNLLQIMGATLDISSGVGKGTSAVVRIPQEISNAQPLGATLAAAIENFEAGTASILNDLEFTPQPMPHGRVLVVDDVDTNLYVAEAMLQAFGLQIELAHGGQETLDKIAQGNTYDIIFLDHMMPEIDGLKVAKILRAQGYNYPIVALTANAIKGQAEMFMENGFSGFMTKPIDIKILHSYLLRYIRG